MSKNFVLGRAGKLFVCFIAVVCTCLVLVTGYYFLGASSGNGNVNKNNQDVKVASMKFPNVAVAEDGKSVVDFQTKKVIFTIDDAKKFLKNSGYEYDPDTFQNSNAKYAGDCFMSAAVSHDGQRIIFSTGCLPGDMPQAWIGVYEISYTDCMDNQSSAASITPVANACIGGEPSYVFRFLNGGGGRNFVWSSDDTNVKYDADLGLMGFSLEKMIDINTGKIMVTEDCEDYGKKLFSSKDECYKWVAQEKGDESFCAKISFPEECYENIINNNWDEKVCDKFEHPELKSSCYVNLAEIKNDYSICKNNNLTEAPAYDCEEYFKSGNKEGYPGSASVLGNLKTYSNTAMGYEIKYSDNFVFLKDGFSRLDENVLNYISLMSYENIYDSKKFVPPEEGGDPGEIILVDVKVLPTSDKDAVGIFQEDLDKIPIKAHMLEALQKGYSGEQGTVYYEEDRAKGIVQKADISGAWLNYSIKFKSAKSGYDYVLEFSLVFEADRRYSVGEGIIVRNDKELIDEFSRVFSSFKFIQ